MLTFFLIILLKTIISLLINHNMDIIIKHINENPHKFQPFHASQNLETYHQLIKITAISS